MVDVTLTIQNDEVAKLRSWIEDQEDALVEDMIAPILTAETDRANTVYRVLQALDVKLADHQLHLARLEEEDKKRR